MEFLFEIIFPLLIFIIVPIVRGINNSNKQKKEYEEKRRKTTYNPAPAPAPQSNTKLWGNIFEELRRDIKGVFEEKNSQKNPVDTISKKEEQKSSLTEYKEDREKISYIGTKFYDENDYSTKYTSPKQQEAMNPITYSQLPHILEEESSEKATAYLEFSQDSILQGIIFSEILGPPKARR